MSTNRSNDAEKIYELLPPNQTILIPLVKEKLNIEGFLEELHFSDDESRKKLEDSFLNYLSTAFMWGFVDCRSKCLNIIKDADIADEIIKYP